jgi:hypothetical protein
MKKDGKTQAREDVTQNVAQEFLDSERDRLQFNEPQWGPLTS